MAEESQNTKCCIYGVDFSGAKDAGKKIWIAKGIIEKSILQIEKCEKAEKFLGTKRELKPCLEALIEFVKGEKSCVFGFDFPFGIHRKLIEEKNWEEFVMSFPKHYTSAEMFRSACRRISRKPELRRDTDINTPFSPYNLRVYYQTYYGIHDILYPLMSNDEICVKPMQSTQSGKPKIIEICPASTLKKLWSPEKPPSYKHNTNLHREKRAQIIDKLNPNIISIPDPIRAIALKDAGGDALDSIIAAYSTFCAYRNNFKVKYNENYSLEGYVYE